MGSIFRCFIVQCIHFLVPYFLLNILSRRESHVKFSRTHAFQPAIRPLVNKTRFCKQRSQRIPASNIKDIGTPYRVSIPNWRQAVCTTPAGNLVCSTDRKKREYLLDVKVQWSKRFYIRQWCLKDLYPWKNSSHSDISYIPPAYSPPRVPFKDVFGHRFTWVVSGFNRKGFSFLCVDFVVSENGFLT